MVSLCVFLAFSLIPGDPAMQKLGTNATPEALEKMREAMGLNKPLFTRYIEWFLGFFSGNLGTSYTYNMPVVSLIADKLPITIVLTIISFILLVFISVPVGIYTAKHEGGITDKIILVLNQIVMGVPAFFFGILISYILGLMLKLFQPGNFVYLDKDPAGFIRYMIFPAIAIALPKAAMAIKLLRSACIEETSKDYARTAFSRGNTVNGVLYGHILKNAMISYVTFLAMTLADMVAGSVVVEQVFGIPGFGRLLITSISNRDYPVVMSIIMILAIMIVVINILVDIIYKILDPRIA